MFEIVMTILLALDALWAGFTPTQEYPLPSGAAFGSYINAADLKAQAANYGVLVAPYYVAVGAVDKPPDTSHLKFEVFPALGATWYTHGSHSCERLVALSGTTWLNKSSVYYGTPFWRAVLAHEWAHVAQGPWCGNWNGESSADLIGYSVMAQAGDAEGLIYGLRREFIMAALTLAIKSDLPRSSVLDQLQLSGKEREYYQHVSASMLVKQGAAYWLPLTKALIEDEDGVYTIASPTRKLDASALWEFIQELQD